MKATAPGKVILFGEHAVVYGRPAIAVPVSQVTAAATITPTSGEFEIQAKDLNRRFALSRAPADDPLAVAVRHSLAHLDQPPPSAQLTINSTIPIASGLGSGAAVSVAIIRALGRFLGVELDTRTVSQLAYEVEKVHHGTPSGIDNSVIAYQRPVYFRRGQPIETFKIKTPFFLLIIDTGIPSPTKVTVGGVRRDWQAEPARFERLFGEIGAVVNLARIAIETGRIDRLGPLMDRNQTLLEAIGVSSPLLEQLISVARSAGAQGAKLSGGGGGGNLIALVEPVAAEKVQSDLLASGAAGVISSWIGRSTS